MPRRSEQPSQRFIRVRRQCGLVAIAGGVEVAKQVAADQPIDRQADRVIGLHLQTASHPGLRELRFSFAMRAPALGNLHDVPFGHPDARCRRAWVPLHEVLEHSARALEVANRQPVHQGNRREQQGVALERRHGPGAGALQFVREHGRADLFDDARRELAVRREQGRNAVGGLARPNCGTGARVGQLHRGVQAIRRDAAGARHHVGGIQVIAQRRRIELAAAQRRRRQPRYHAPVRGGGQGGDDVVGNDVADEARARLAGDHRQRNHRDHGQRVRRHAAVLNHRVDTRCTHSVGAYRPGQVFEVAFAQVFNVRVEVRRDPVAQVR